ncbi:hypothetical protein [Albidovulum sp.]
MTFRLSGLAANQRMVLAIAGFGLLIDRLSPAGTTRDRFAPVGVLLLPVAFVLLAGLV